MKRSLALLLALVMLIGLVPMQAFASENEANPWEGRSAVFVGDSITAGSSTTKTYYQFLKENLGFGSVTPMGVAGSCISASSDYGQSNQPLINRYQNIPSTDLIVIFMGTNDYGHETPLGNAADTQDGTFCGALNTIIPALVAKHTSSKIVFVTPLHRYGFGTSKILGTQFTYDNIPNGVGATLSDYVDALKTVCANNGVSVIDLHTECTLDPADAAVRSTYMPDGLHPNASGHEVIAGILESHIRTFEPAEAPETETNPTEPTEPAAQTELVYGNRFAAGNNQTCRASSRINYYLKAGTVITLNDSAAMQWACTKTADESSSGNRGYFPDGGWSDKETAVVAEDGWVGFVFKYRDETRVFDLTKPLSDYITIEEPHTHTYENGICTGCGENEPSESMSLRYDDHLDMSGKTVEIIDAGKPTSYQVGYGVEENQVLDTAVVTLEGDTLVATGIGTAIVKVDGETYEITVTAAPISLLLIIGQSNAEGMVGRAHQSIACENGQVYSTYAEANGLTGDAGLTVDNAGNYVPSALTGAYSTININGTDSKISNYPVNSLTEAGNGKYGMDSGIAYEWVQQTGEKVWVVNAAHGASSISSWQPGESNFEEAVALMDACQNVLTKEIAAGHFTFSHMGYYWCQGCADETKSAQWYVERYVSMHEALKVDMAFDADLNPVTTAITMEFGGIILVMAGHENATGYRKGTYKDESEQFFATFKELEMRGPRVAQIWLASNPNYPDIHLVCMLAQDWVTMPDGSDGVAEYFASHYENGVIDYPTQVKQSTSWYSPTTPAHVKNSIHYYQVGYNEVGRESARNTLYILDVIKKPNVDTTVSFVDWTGYQTVDSITSSGVGSSDTLIVPLVSPCYESKTVSYTLSDGLSWNYYDLLDTGVDGGTLTTSIDTQKVAVTGREYCAYRFELVDGKLVSVSNDTFRENLLTATTVNTYTLEDTILLKHDKKWIVEFNSVAADRFMALASYKGSTDGMFYFFKSKSGSGVLSIGEYKDGLYQNYGLKQTQINIDWTQPHVYRFQNVINPDGTNIIHIYIDGEWRGTATNLIINDVLQSTDNMYLSGKDFAFVSIGCGGFGFGDNQMTYIEVWEDYHTHTYENGICTGCGEAQPGPVITQQPVNAEAKLGERYCVTVEAEGEGLTYQWYIRNAGSRGFSKSSVKDNTYDDVMTEARAGREVYCVITDANGNSVTTDTVKLVLLPSEELAIVTQPTDGEAALGERYCVTVEAKGEGLRYQWYFRNNGATRWTKSSVTDNTYDDVMNNTRNGREVYCVITDLAGNKVTTNIVKLVRTPAKLEITTQPIDATAPFGEMFCATVEAKGEGLKYQWYYRNAGGLIWRKSGVRDNTYDDLMTKARNGREVYCVITDKYGNSVTTDIVKLIAVPKVELKLLGQSYESAAMGERFCVTVEAEGEGLTYQWYFRNAGATRWSKSGVHDNTYDDVMNRTRANREVYCVITDAFGNQVTTEVVTIHIH